MSNVLLAKICGFLFTDSMILMSKVVINRFSFHKEKKVLQIFSFDVFDSLISHLLSYILATGLKSRSLSWFNRVS